MNLLLLLTALCLGIASATTKYNQSLDAEWHKWVSKHRRLYATVSDISAVRGSHRGWPSWGESLTEC